MDVAKGNKYQRISPTWGFSFFVTTQKPMNGSAVDYWDDGSQISLVSFGIRSKPLLKWQFVGVSWKLISSAPHFRSFSRLNVAESSVPEFEGKIYSPGKTMVSYIHCPFQKPTL